MLHKILIVLEQHIMNKPV